MLSASFIIVITSYNKEHANHAEDWNTEDPQVLQLGLQRSEKQQIGKYYYSCKKNRKESNRMKI